VSATTLTWAGIAHPKWTEGQNLFVKDFKARDFVGSGRDRCDHTIERVRTIRTDRYRYTRNYLLDRVVLQPQYRDSKDYLKSLRQAYADGTLAPKLAEIYFGERPAEELYDIAKDPAQVNNLAKSVEHQDALAKHRKILDTWVAKGDLGAGQEPKIELEMNGNGRFKGVNPEYERVRTDSDGDGLSDRWEKFNGRDANDGRLQFEFNCGGWQTEGWKSDGNLTNIAGRQGFLDFDLLSANASISRSGLKLDAAKNQGKLAIRLRTTAATKLSVSANGKVLGTTSSAGNNQFATVKIPLGATWAGTIESLQITWSAPKSTTVEIDWIRIQ
jgi:N-sulfoglucosamine sulfohydrolase